jgi:tetratricopeptide (TPR) repeat protein
MMRGITAIAVVAFLIAGQGLSYARPPDVPLRMRNALAEAEQLMSLGMVAEAMERYRVILDKVPENQDAFWGFVNAARSLGEYEEVIELLEAHLEESEGPEFRMRRVLGDAYYNTGEIDQAVAAWKSMIDVDPTNVDSYAEAGAVLTRFGLYPEAIEIYHAGRKQAASRELFARELASIYEANGQYKEAVSEYARILAGSKAQLSWVTSKLTIMLDSGADEDEVLGELNVIIEQDPENAQFHKLRGHVLLFLERPDEALDSFMQVESLEKTDGAMLLDFAIECTELGMYDPAEEAIRVLISERPESKLVPQAQLQLAEILYAKGDLARAADAFAELAEATGRREIAAKSLIRASEILLDDLGRPSDALSMLEGFEDHYATQKLVFEARILRGDAYVVMGLLDDALGELNRALEAARKKQEEDVAYFKIGLARFYKHEFAEALAVWRDNIAADPTSALSNDALELALVVNRAGKDQEALVLYADALLLERQKKYNEAVTALENLAERFPLSSVTDESLILLAELELMLGDPQGALVTLERVTFEFPDSHLAPVAMDRSADILAAQVGDTEQALDTYMEILTKYPRSYLVEEVRRKILELRS